MKYRYSREGNRPSRKGLKNSKQLVTFFVSIIIFSYIIVTSTVSAINVGLEGLDDGQIIPRSVEYSFQFKINIESGEFISIIDLVIKLDGAVYQFNPFTSEPVGTQTNSIKSVILLNSEAIQKHITYGCLNVKINPHKVNECIGYGNGYGLPGPRTLEYEITIRPQHFSHGSHSIQIEAILDQASSVSTPITTFFIPA